MKPILIAEDALISRGKVGIFAEKINEFYVDKVHLEHFSCQEPQPHESEQNAKFFAPSCSRFKENYYGFFNQQWNVVEPQIGMSEWKYVKEKFGRANVIYQTQMNADQNVRDEPCIAILQRNKICGDGNLTFNFYANNNNGTIGIAFRYEDRYNYYLLEFAYGVRNTVIQSRIQDGIKQKLAETESQFPAHEWNKVQLLMNQSEISVWKIENDNSREVVLFTKDKMFPEGYIGMSLYKMDGAFDQILLQPIEQFIKIEKETIIEQHIKEYRQCTNLYPGVQIHFCRERYNEESIPFDNCLENFCSICCGNYINGLFKMRIRDCNKRCDKTLKKFTPKDNRKRWVLTNTSYEQSGQNTRLLIDHWVNNIRNTQDVLKAKLNYFKTQYKSLANNQTFKKYFNETTKDLLKEVQQTEHPFNQFELADVFVNKTTKTEFILKNITKKVNHFQKLILTQVVSNIQGLQMRFKQIDSKKKTISQMIHHLQSFQKLNKTELNGYFTKFNETIKNFDKKNLTNNVQQIFNQQNDDFKQEAKRYIFDTVDKQNKELDELKQKIEQLKQLSQKSTQNQQFPRFRQIEKEDNKRFHRKILTHFIFKSKIARQQIMSRYL